MNTRRVFLCVMMLALLVSMTWLSNEQSVNKFDDGSAEVLSAPPPPSTCTISVRIDHDKVKYQTYIQLLRENRSPTLKVPRRLGLGRYRYINVPEGRYTIKVRGKYPVGQGREGGLAPFSVSDEILVCRPNETVTAHFEIRSTEG